MTSKLRVLALGVLLATSLPTAMAHGLGGHRGGYHGGYHGGYYYYGGNYGWWPAFVGGAILGTTIYLSRPMQPSTVVVTSPPTVVVNTPAQAPVEAYYCRDTGQYFPVAQTCPTPWLVVNAQ